MAKVKIGTKDMVEENSSRLFVVDGKEIAVFNVEGKYYAIDNKCPHQGIGLCTGSVEDGVVSCPGHGWEFDLETGKGTMMPVSVRKY